MKLRFKLFIQIGLLLIGMAFLLFLLLTFLAKRELIDSSDQILLIVQQEGGIEIHGDVAHAKEAFRHAINHLDRGMIKGLSLHTLWVCLGTLLIALLILDRIATSLSRPIAQLAQATSYLASGQFAKIHLPDVGKRQDEIALLTHSFERAIKEIKEREHLRAVLDKVVSKEVATQILATPLHLGGEDRVVTMLFSDIRGFTQLTEYLSPQETILLLNTCMTKMSRVIEGEGGIIDKYVGDEIMALYGAPNPHPDHALRALSSATLMIQALKRWNSERKEQGLTEIEMGIGIHTGIVVAGNMGAEDRLNYTVLGANVNLASRLCASAKPSQIIISESTLEAPNIKESFYVSPLPPITLKGFDKPVNIFEVTDFKWG